MFGFRPDGTKIKCGDAIEKIMPHIMTERSDAQNWCEVDMRCETLDEYINDAHARTGISINYMTIVIASLVRVFSLRRRLNRFVMNGRIFQRNALYFSITIKASLRDDAPDLSTKIRFDGTETIFEVKEKVESTLTNLLKKQTNNGTNKLAGVLTGMPNFLVKGAVGLVKFLDKHGMLPNSILNLSPFHTSVWVTNLKSIKGNWIYHHCYNFGTLGLYVCMGKEKEEAVVENGEVKSGKVIRFGVTMDERYCDGFYYIKSLKMWRDFMMNPRKLEVKPDVEPIESKKERKKRIKNKNKQKIS